MTAIWLTSGRVVALSFPSSEEGPTTGSLLKFRNEVSEKGTLLIIKREGRLATGWLVESKGREIMKTDFLE
jgi:hypothetical protein